MSDFWHYKNGKLYGGEVELLSVAKKFGTPTYVYSQDMIETQWHAYKKGLENYPHRLCYAVKANSNLAILQLLARLDAGFDIVSVGELERVLRAGGDPQKVVFSGVGKNVAEIERALEVNIYCFNVESLPELERIQQVAQQRGQIAKVSLRVNPNINAQTHPYISTGLRENKFGINIDDAVEAFVFAKSLPNIEILGVDCHIGSQITDVAPFLATLDSLLELIHNLEKNGISIEHIDLGGGLGVTYDHENPPAPEVLCAAIIKKLPGKKFTLALEPGRSIVANAGMLLTTVEYIKSAPHKNFAIVDAGMNDLIRPALYQAWQSIMPLQVKHNVPENLYDVVGPVCESADFLGKERKLAIEAGDYLGIGGSGAYGFVMSSQYNSRPRAAEVLLTFTEAKLIRARETLADLWTGEILL